MAEDRDAQVAYAEAFARIGSGYVLVDPLVKRKVGLIELPDEHVKKATRGTVLAVSKGRRTEHGAFIETEAKVGDDVIFAMHSRTHAVKLTAGKTERELFMLKDEDVLAVVKPGVDVQIAVGATDVVSKAKQ